MCRKPLIWLEIKWYQIGYKETKESFECNLSLSAKQNDCSGLLVCDKILSIRYILKGIYIIYLHLYKRYSLYVTSIVKQKYVILNSFSNRYFNKRLNDYLVRTLTVLQCGVNEISSSISWGRVLNSFLVTYNVIKLSESHFDRLRRTTNPKSIDCDPLKSI